jgi:hypothetical protein
MLHTLSGHHREAFMRYEECMMPFLRGKQWSAAKFASSFVPKTATGIRYRNVVTGLLHVPAIAEFVIGRNLHDDPTIPLDIEIALTRAEAPQPGTPGTRTRSYP